MERKTIATTVIAGLTLFALAIPAQAGLVAWWDFNEGSGTLAADAVGGHDGTVVNAPGWVTGQSGGGSDYALDFTAGPNHRVEVPGFTGIAGRAARTISAWIQSDTTNGTIASWGTNTAEQKWVFRTQTGNGPAETLRVEVNGGYQVGTTDIVGTAGWTHVAATWENDGTPDVEDVKLYVNGVQESGATLPKGINTNTDQIFWIGNQSFQDVDFDGRIDDVAVWNRALTAAEIAQLAGGAAPTGIATVVPKAALDYTAAADTTPTNGTWEDLTNISTDHDWAISGNAGGARRTTTVDPVFGTVQAYSFSPADTATTATMETFPGNPTNDSASFEILFRPSDTTGQEILFETGGTTGTSLAIDGTSLLFTTAGNSAATTTQLAFDGVKEGYLHAVAVIERTASGSSLLLYVNGELVASDTSALTDWAGTDGAGLGQLNGSAAGGNYGGILNGFGDYTGEISLFRFYDTALTVADARELFLAQVPEPATMALLGLAACGLGGYIRKRRKA